MKIEPTNPNFDAVQVQLSPRNHWVMTTISDCPIALVQSWHFTDRKQALMFAEDMADDYGVQLTIFNGEDDL